MLWDALRGPLSLACFERIGHENVIQNSVGGGSLEYVRAVCGGSCGGPADIFLVPSRRCRRGLQRWLLRPLSSLALLAERAGASLVSRQLCPPVSWLPPSRLGL